MKPQYEHVEIGNAASIKVRTYIRKRIRVPFHYHPEQEIVMVLEGRGKAIVGDSITTYSKGQLFFIGGNVPHLFVDDQPTNYSKGTTSGQVVVIQFKEDLFKNMLDLPEFSYAGMFLSKTRYGIKLDVDACLREKIIALEEAGGLEKLNTLAYLFDHIERN